MDFGRLVFIFQSAGYECVCADDSVDKVRTALNHSLVYEPAERFFLADITEVVEEFVPETGIDEVPCGMLGASNVEVDVAPIFVCLAAHESVRIVRIHIAEVVGAAAGKTGHRTGFERIALIVPVLRTCKRRLSRLSRKIFVNFRKAKRKLVFRKRGGNAVLVANRERLSPVALAGEDGVTKAVIDLAMSQTMAFHIVNRSGNGLLNAHSIKETGVAHCALLCIETAFADVAAFDERDYRKVECLCKGIVAAVMGRHSHNCTRAVAGEHIFGNPHRHLLARERVHRIRAGEHAGDCLGL